MAGGAASHLSRGGMTTKVEAGKIATQAGTAMIIAKGTENHPLRALTEGAPHTLFAASRVARPGPQALDHGHARTARRRARRCRRRPVRCSMAASLLPIGVTRRHRRFRPRRRHRRL